MRPKLKAGLLSLRVRKDGRLMNDMLLAEVKAPAEVKQGWDLLKIKQRVKVADIMRPVDVGGCMAFDGPELA